MHILRLLAGGLAFVFCSICITILMLLLDEEIYLSHAFAEGVIQYRLHFLPFENDDIKKVRFDILLRKVYVIVL